MSCPFEFPISRPGLANGAVRRAIRHSAPIICSLMAYMFFLALMSISAPAFAEEVEETAVGKAGCANLEEDRPDRRYICR